LSDFLCTSGQCDDQYMKHGDLLDGTKGWASGLNGLAAGAKERRTLPLFSPDEDAADGSCWPALGLVLGEAMTVMPLGTGLAVKHCMSWPVRGSARRNGPEMISSPIGNLPIIEAAYCKIEAAAST